MFGSSSRFQNFRFWYLCDVRSINNSRNLHHYPHRQHHNHGGLYHHRCALAYGPCWPASSSQLKLQAPVYDILPSTTAVFSYAIGSRKLSANEQFFVGAQTAASLLQTTQIISDVCFITDHVVYASSDKTKIVWIETELFFFFTRGGCASCLRACLGARLLPQSYQYPNLSEVADRVGGHAAARR